MGPQENHSAKTHFEQKERKNVVIFLQRYLTFLIMLQKFCNVFLLQKKILQHLFFQFLGWAINSFFIKMQHCCVLMKNVARGPLALVVTRKKFKFWGIFRPLWRYKTVKVNYNDSNNNYTNIVFIRITITAKFAVQTAIYIIILQNSSSYSICGFTH